MTTSLIEAVARAIGDFMSSADVALDVHTEAARATLSAIEASGTHVVVPKEPTREMLAEFEGADVSDWTDVRAGYQDMLSARPRVTP